MHILNRNQVLELQAHLDAITATLKASEISLDGLVKDTPSPTKLAKYEACILGDKVSASTLPALVVGIIEWFEGNDPKALERLAATEARLRRYVGKRREVIHPGRQDLPVIRSAGGWYTSANIGFEDASRWVEAMCAAARLKPKADLVIERNVR